MPEARISPDFGREGHNFAANGFFHVRTSETCYPGVIPNRFYFAFILKNFI